jgi:hypothetical protein
MMGAFVMIQPGALWHPVAALIPFSVRHVIVQDGSEPFMLTTLPCGRSVVETLETAPGVH